jgi:tetratricopeptide (TPR) repeat protein
MSLCDLATEAKSLCMPGLQLELTSEATRQNLEDGWAWAQHADALLANQQLPQALDAYDNAVAFGESLVGSTGRAEVLKAMNRLPEALAAFEETIAAIRPMSSRATVAPRCSRP